MKNLILLYFMLILPFFYGQIKKENKKKCYEKSLTFCKIGDYSPTQTKILNCNENLEYEERKNKFGENIQLILSKNGGMPYTGICETCFENGQREMRLNIKQGVETGIDTTFYQSGCIMGIRSHIDGIKTGKWSSYYDSTNQLEWELNFKIATRKDGLQITVKNGVHIFIEPNGDTSSLETYQDNLLNGIRKTFYEQGKLHELVSYKKGKIDGQYIEYNFNGKVIAKLNFKKGKKDGLNTFYFEDGVILRSELWEQNAKNGTFTTYYHEGFIKSTENYKKGLKEGWFEDFYQTRKVHIKSLYEKDELIEEHEFNEKGKEIRRFPEIEKEEAETEDDEIEVPTKKGKKEKKEKKKKEKK